MARIREMLQQKAGKQLPQGAGMHNPSHTSSHKSGRKMKRKKK